jgi:hypothetical protein
MRVFSWFINQQTLLGDPHPVSLGTLGISGDHLLHGAAAPWRGAQRESAGATGGWVGPISWDGEIPRWGDLAWGFWKTRMGFLNGIWMGYISPYCILGFVWTWGYSRNWQFSILNINFWGENDVFASTRDASLLGMFIPRPKAARGGGCQANCWATQVTRNPEEASHLVGCQPW